MPRKPRRGRVLTVNWLLQLPEIAGDLQRFIRTAPDGAEKSKAITLLNEVAREMEFRRKTGSAWRGSKGRAKGRCHMATNPDPKKARRLIKELEQDLRREHYYGAAEAFRRYLDGKARTLDEAFGLTAAKSRGRPVIRRDRHLEIAREMLEFRLRPEAGKQDAIGRFEQSLADKYHLSDARKVRAIYARYYKEVAIKELLRRRE